MGKLYFYHGTMNSSKSANIIMQVYGLRKKGSVVLPIKPKQDTRSETFIKSRALSDSITAYQIETEEDLKTVQNYMGVDKIDFIFVDEAHFLSSPVILTLRKWADNYDVKIMCYGLKNSYTGELFEGSKVLFEIADSIREIKSQCDHCDKKATMHLRKVNGEYVFDGNKIHVGDLDEYESVCATCFFKAKEQHK